MASGMNPSSLKSDIEVTPSRLESLRPSLFSIRGVWANSGTIPSKASYNNICLGVFPMWSSPRITWVTPISRSSTTTAIL